MVTPAVVQAFRSIGWGWGGTWSSSTKDYMHFSATGHQASPSGRRARARRARLRSRRRRRLGGRWDPLAWGCHVPVGSLSLRRCMSGEDDVKRWGVVVIVLATIASLAGCGSGKSNNAAPTSSGSPNNPSGPRTRSAASKPVQPKVSTRAGEHRQALRWIRRLQRDLSRLHFYSGPVTGVETPETKTSVIRFQRAAHLKPDGLWGSKSQAALDKMLHRHK